MEQLAGSFEKEGIDYALMGGFALGIWGAQRATIDIDFLILLEDMERAHGILTGLGYKLRHKSPNVSQYVSPLKTFGEIDFLHAFRDVSKSMLRRARKKEIFGAGIAIKVLQPEDIIGLKVQALSNDPSRTACDLADIESLMHLHGARLDWQLMQSYFELFGMLDLFSSLRSRYGDTA
jgi:hypothetical protein